jgi:hypothetical protein
MYGMLKEMCQHLGFELGEDGRIVNAYTHKQYIHYDELEPFTKLNIFKGVCVSPSGHIILQFIGEKD